MQFSSSAEFFLFKFSYEFNIYNGNLPPPFLISLSNSETDGNGTNLGGVDVLLEYVEIEDPDDQEELDITSDKDEFGLGMACGRWSHALLDGNGTL